ncbi:hypothetical protein [Paenibacillus aceti]|uniref:DUF3813 domain-containing protein n=1 Tax=Paenibacillus aceti TaxID=1820010 RepID=A0ABQ1VUM5_9BACL|nr:hypothetical protein [Paenibacillus aceti]GGG00065.1 hypothetical protein GCM10010913_22300 [Paenibacillus aceti]
MKRYDSSLQADSTVARAQNSVNKLHHAVSQALSHPTEQTVEQAENSMEHAEQSIRQVNRSLGPQGVELAEEMLAVEKDRLDKLNQQQETSER